LSDEPISIKIAGSGSWRPQNYDRKFRGDVTFREALAKSLNVPTVNLARKIGIDKVARTAGLFGFGDDLPVVPSLALGAGEVSPLELARAYGALANGGLLIDLRPIVSMKSRELDETLLEVPLREVRAASEQPVYILTDMLRSVVETGTARVIRRMGVEGPVAGKTGTSNEGKDSWFAGYTPALLAVVWVGFDDNTAAGLTGSSGAAPIWARFMKCVSPMEPKLDFVPPPGVVVKRVDLRSGLLSSSNCPNSIDVNEVFIAGTEPVTYCGGSTRGQGPKIPRKKPERRPDNKPSFWDLLFG
jgi:penicillin-binding protein 1B